MNNDYTFTTDYSTNTYNDTDGNHYYWWVYPNYQKTCVCCGYLIGFYDKYCKFCGKEQIEKKYCPTCGKELEK